MSNNGNDQELPDSPPEFECSITAERMKDPVIAERWFQLRTCRD